MAFEVYFKSARGFLDDNKIAWAPLFQAVKAIIKHNDISDSTRTCIKGWLKSADSMVALMSLTVIETLACNAPIQLRNQMCGPRWMDRFEKLLTKSPSTVVQSGVAQLLVDYVHLFSGEELGRAAQNLLAQSKNSWWQSMAPSDAVQDIRNEWQLGLPPVGPYKPHDFTQALRQAMASSSSSRSEVLPGLSTSLSRSSTPAQPLEGSAHAGVAFTLSGLGSGGGAGLVRPTSISGVAALPSAAPRSMTTTTSSSRLARGSGAGSKADPEQVPGLTSQMRDTSRALLEAVAQARAALAHVAGSRALTASLHNMWAQRLAAPHQSVQGAISPALPPALTAHVDKGFQTAERCSRWRVKVAELCQALSDPAAISQLLTALDSVNAALSDWQSFCSGGQMFQGLGLTGDLAASWRRTSSPAAPPTDHVTPPLLDLGEEPPQGTATTSYNASLLDDLTSRAAASHNQPHLPPVTNLLTARPHTHHNTASNSSSSPPVPLHTPPPTNYPPVPVLPLTSPATISLPPDPANPFNTTHIAQPVPHLTAHQPASSHLPTSAVTQPYTSTQAHPFPPHSTTQPVSVMTRGIAVAAPAVVTHRSPSSHSHELRRNDSSTGGAPPPALPVAPPPFASRTGSFSADIPQPGEPDWHAELATVITNSANRHMVSLRLEGELRDLITRMQQHYTSVISSTKEKAVRVVKQLKQQVQEQEQQYKQQHSAHAGHHHHPAHPHPYSSHNQQQYARHPSHPTPPGMSSTSPFSSVDDPGGGGVPYSWQSHSHSSSTASHQSHAPPPATFEPFPRSWEPPTPGPGAIQACREAPLASTGPSQRDTSGKAAAYPVITTNTWELI